MQPELLAGKMHALAQEETVKITPEIRDQLELASDFLLAAQDFRDTVEEAAERLSEESVHGVAKVLETAVIEFDATVVPTEEV